MNTLLIDDDYISVFLTERLLQQETFTEGLLTFHSSQQALHYLQQLPPDQPARWPEVIFLDLNMPIMSGWDFLRALCPYEQQLLGHCRIYILTSSLAPCDAARAQDFALVAGFIHKPLDSMELQVIRAQLIESS